MAIAIAILAVVAAVLLGGCGGGSGDSSSTAQPSGEPSKEFQDPKGAKGVEPVATFGQEAEEAERGEASSVLTESLTAREAADFKAQCATLGKRGLEAVLGKGKKAADASKCAATLKKLAQPLANTKKFRVNNLSGEIAALRVKGNQAYALYHGTDKLDYAMPMEKEGGVWKVGGILAIELPQAKPKPSPKSKPGSKAETKKEG